MQQIKGGGKKSPNKLQRQRQGLLAVVHIAKKDLGLTDADYSAVLIRYGVSSAAALSIPELENLVEYFESLGFKKRKKSGSKKWKRPGTQAAALRERILSEASKLDNWEKRLTGLVRKICGVEKLEWCSDVRKLKSLLKCIVVIGQDGKDRLESLPHN